MIHIYKQFNYNICLDIASGSIHILDDLTSDILKLLNLHIKSPKDSDTNKKAKEFANNANLQDEFFNSISKKLDYSSSDIQESLLEIIELINSDTLFSTDSYEDIVDHFKIQNPVVKALCLNVAHTCNLSCNYCFASQGKYHGKSAIMSEEVAKRAIDFLIENSGLRRNLDIDFFGGEPMLNWNLIKNTVEYAKSKEKEYKKNFRFTFTTNGMLLDSEVGEFLNKNMKNVVLSLDGRKEVHDRLRKTPSGKGSYDTIVPRFQEFVSTRGDQEYYIRGTYTKFNLDFTKDIFHMADLGFSRLSMEPVIGDSNEEFMLGMSDLKELENQYDILANEMLRRNINALDYYEKGLSDKDIPIKDRPFVFYHFMVDLEEGPCIYKRISGCGSGTEYMAVTPTGELFPCHQFVGDNEFSMGNIFDGIKNIELREDFSKCTTTNRNECKICWAKLYCSGGCSANSLHATGSLLGTSPFACELFKKRMECAIALQVALAIEKQNRNTKKL